MSRKSITAVVGIVLLGAAGFLFAQPGMREMGGRRGAGGRGGAMAFGRGSFEAAPVPKDDAERKILAVLDELERGQSGGMMNVPMHDGRLLRLLAETTNAQQIVELGTSNGYSGIWQCLALKSTGGRLTTYEIDAGRAALARENFRRAGVDDIVTLVEGDAHQEVQNFEGQIDILFLDADKEGYIDYLNKLLPKVRPGGLILAHNINAGQADARYIEAITTNGDLETIFLSDGAGMSLTLKKRPLSQ